MLKNQICNAFDKWISFFFISGIPFFIAGMAGGAEFYPKEKKQRSFMILKIKLELLYK